ARSCFWKLEFDLEERSDIPCNADVSQRIRAVGCDVEFEDRLPGLFERVEETSSRDERARRIRQDASTSVRQPELGLAAQHALAGHASDIARAEHEVDTRQLDTQSSENH